MNNLDKQYQDLLQDILDNGITKFDRTGTGTKSVFGRQIKHKMSEGFPLLTTKKMAWKQVVTELIWFLRGDTNIKYLLDNNCHIWDGDAYKKYVQCCNLKPEIVWTEPVKGNILTQEEFINKIKTDNEFAQKWGDLGPIYGKQWRNWYVKGDGEKKWIDQIATLINDLKTNPDSRRLMVNAWNVAEINQMTLPPCHFSFQCYTRELSLQERLDLWENLTNKDIMDFPIGPLTDLQYHEVLNELDIPTRAISLMWNQRSVDTFLGLPFNIASYGLLLEIIAKIVNMMPDELIGSLGDTHLYLNHIEPAKEQLLNEPYKLPTLNTSENFNILISKYNGIYSNKLTGNSNDYGYYNNLDNTILAFIRSDFQLENYTSHPKIEAPLSN